MTTARVILALAAKDLRIEFRTRHSIGVVVILGVLIVAVLALGLGPETFKGGAGATGVLWVAYLFGGILCFERTAAVERDEDALAGLLLAPVSRGALFGAKLVVNLVLLLGMALVIAPVGVVLLRFDLSAAPLGFARITVLSMIGFAALGTLFAAIATSSQVRTGLVGLLVLPLCLPLVLVSSRQMLALFSGAPGRGVPGEALIVAFDVVFIVASWLMYEAVMEA